MASDLALLMQYGQDPLRVWNLEKLDDQGHLPPPQNPGKYRAFLIAAARELEERRVKLAGLGGGG